MLTRLKMVMKSLRRNFGIWVCKRLSFSDKQMAKYAYDNTVLYQTLYQKAVEKFGSIEKIPFKHLPIVKKATLNNFMPFDLLSKEKEKEVFKYAETTGSTGNPTPSFYTPKEFNGSYLLSRLTPFQTMLNDVIADNRRAVCGLACGFTIAGLSFQQILDKSGFLTINVDARNTIAPPQRVARLISRFKPSIIVASETDFLAWMKILKEEYVHQYEEIVNTLKVLISTAELCSENRSAQISKHFNIVHIDNYACVEGYFSVPCPCGEKHILPIYQTEVLSDDLKQSLEFGKGRFAFTNLFRKSTPFVRYLLDDLVTIYPSQCKYGFKKSIIPHGRYELSVKLGNIRYGTRDFENILFHHYLFGEYQVQIYNNKIVIEAEDYLYDMNIPIDKIKQELIKRFKMPVQLKLLPYGLIRDYKKIRETKPMLRLTDNRIFSTQQIPKYL
ncbi:MAG: phenylacetate--CoA ligase family protein [Spirochaetes bacterium]|nr:phenylacetate--CoA ligase family protein [Spirochaetota bacterium]